MMSCSGFPGAAAVKRTRGVPSASFPKISSGAGKGCVMKVSSEQAPRYQPWSKHLRVWTGKDEASVGESDPQRLKDASVVHQHIHRAEDVRRFFEHALHIGRLGDVSLDRDRLATMAGHLRHGALRSCF